MLEWYIKFDFKTCSPSTKGNSAWVTPSPVRVTPSEHLSYFKVKISLSKKTFYIPNQKISRELGMMWHLLGGIILNISDFWGHQGKQERSPKKASQLLRYSCSNTFRLVRALFFFFKLPNLCWISEKFDYLMSRFIPPTGSLELFVMFLKYWKSSSSSSSFVLKTCRPPPLGTHRQSQHQPQWPYWRFDVGQK